MAGTNVLNLDRAGQTKAKPKLPAPAKFDPKKDYFATLHTSLGDITVKFYPDVAPQHVTAWINLAELGYYDGHVFHRIIPGFMMQGGDPSGSGSGGPGYTMKAEFNSKKHVRGTLSTARTSDPNSAGSQFFICFTAYPSLDRQYTVFGETVAGDEVLTKFEAIGTSSGSPKARESIKTVDVFTKDK